MPSRKAPRPKPRRRPEVRILFTRISDYDRRAACLVQFAIHIPMRLAPDPLVTPEDVERGKPALVKDAAWASLVGSLYGGVILVGFALELGATPWHIGLLSAVPFLAQVAQLPAIALIERFGERRKIAVIFAGLSRLLIGLLALIVLVPDKAAALRLLIAAQVGITLFGSIGGCAFNSWLHQLLAAQGLGALFSRRLFWSTVLASAGALAAGYAIQRWPGAQRLDAYALSFAAAGAVGFIGLYYLALAPGNRGRKLAAHGGGTHYLAVVALAGAFASGVAAITGGALADWFASRELSVFVHLTSASAAHELIVMNFRHWEFLFGISFLCGAYVLHALSRVDEGAEHSERQVIQEFVAEASRSLSQLSPIDGLKDAVLFPIGRVRDRRLRGR